MLLPGRRDLLVLEEGEKKVEKRKERKGVCVTCANTRVLDLPP